MDLSGSIHHLCQCFRCWDLSSFCSCFEKDIFFTCRLRNTKLQIQETRSQVKKFSALLCKKRCKSQGSLKLFAWYVPQPPGAGNPAFWVSSGFTIRSAWGGCSPVTGRWQVFPFLGEGSCWRAVITDSISQAFPFWSWMTIIWETFHDQLLSHVAGRLIPDQSKKSWYVTPGVEFWTRPHQ